MKQLVWLPIFTVMLCGFASPSVSQQSRDPAVSAFDHGEHRGLFPSCLTCHPGVSTPGLAVWPTPASCTTCHDGHIEERVAYTPATLPPRTNLVFEHATHATAITADGQSGLRCIQCHAEPDAPWMSVQLAQVSRCLSCHEETEEHFEVADASCAECHVTLADAKRLSRNDVAAFAAPRSHERVDFGISNHGHEARDGITGTVAASCATCHARDFCVVCHVDAPEQDMIQALERDARSLAHEASLPTPVSHNDPDFLTEHGTESLETRTSCLTCHTQESCTACHAATPEVAARLHRSGPGRGVGAAILRSSPQSHTSAYRSSHGAEASTVPASCAGCHARQECLDCHRPDAAAAPQGYHELGYLTRHASAAYARETTCSDCHNDRSFCASCHLATGLTSVTDGVLGSGYHDAKRGFALGHGVAARQSLETCVTCHSERDCLSCHSARGARRFNPHGPGFDAARLRARNPQMCTACHTTIPNVQ